jgi:hypothetical protein
MEVRGSRGGGRGLRRSSIRHKNVLSYDSISEITKHSRWTYGLEIPIPTVSRSRRPCLRRTGLYPAHLRSYKWTTHISLLVPTRASCDSLTTLLTFFHPLYHARLSRGINLGWHNINFAASLYLQCLTVEGSALPT